LRASGTATLAFYRDFEQRHVQPDPNRARQTVQAPHGALRERVCIRVREHSQRSFACADRRVRGQLVVAAEHRVMRDVAGKRGNRDSRSVRSARASCR
jgi:hypothetical protein